MNGPAQYLHFGFILISVANLLVIALLIVVFVLAVALWRPEKHCLSTLEAVPKAEDASERNLTVKTVFHLREYVNISLLILTQAR